MRTSASASCARRSRSRRDKAIEPSTKVEILPNREMRPQGQVLKDEPELASVRRYMGATSGRNRGAIQQHLSAIRHLQSGDDPEHRRLAAPARSEHDGCRAGQHFEGDAVQRHVGSESLRDVDQRNRGCFHLASRMEATTPNAATGTKITADCISASMATLEDGVLAMIV